MIEKLLLKELVAFDKVSLDFSDGLVVITGPSGAGKSVLMGALLSSFGYTMPSYASMSEVALNKPDNMQSELYMLDDELVVKSLKKDKVRHYLNDQNIPKKSLEEMFSPYVRYLSVRDKSGLDSKVLLSIVDSSIASSDDGYIKKLAFFREKYYELKNAQRELEEIHSKEAKIASLIEMTIFEIQKIDSINPKIGEDEELLEIKQQLSRIDKLKDALNGIQGIFDYEHKVFELYRITNKDSSLLADAFNQLRVDTEEMAAFNDELQEMDIESVLNRIEAISSLKNRYGSIEEAIDFKARKIEELNSYKHIEEDKSQLEQFISNQIKTLDILSSAISVARNNEIKALKSRIDPLLGQLKLPNAFFDLHTTSMTESGIDEITLSLGNSKISTLSGGEFNRLRLALLVSSTSHSSKQHGVVILDEIDANVSGDESIAIANMLVRLSNVYQVFAISHQPHLASKANQHILVTKDFEKSQAIVLSKDDRIEEIARIVGGEQKSEEALKFAKALVV
ncbi:MAG: DNA recombination protein RecN [Sulfurovaceae bacterium]|nr:DNA recombination protein RecN [Sulfurovaceae bacterium]